MQRSIPIISWAVCHDELLFCCDSRDVIHLHAIWIGRWHFFMCLGSHLVEKSLHTGARLPKEVAFFAKFLGSEVLALNALFLVPTACMWWSEIDSTLKICVCQCFVKCTQSFMEFNTTIVLDIMYEVAASILYDLWTHMHCKLRDIHRYKFHLYSYHQSSILFIEAELDIKFHLWTVRLFEMWFNENIIQESFCLCPWEHVLKASSTVDLPHHCGLCNDGSRFLRMFQYTSGNYNHHIT